MQLFHICIKSIPANNWEILTNTLNSCYEMQYVCLDTFDASK